MVRDPEIAEIAFKQLANDLLCYKKEILMLDGEGQSRAIAWFFQLYRLSNDPEKMKKVFQTVLTTASLVPFL